MICVRRLEVKGTSLSFPINSFRCSFFSSLYSSNVHILLEKQRQFFFKYLTANLLFFSIFCRWAGPTGLWDKTTGFNVVLWFVMRTSWSKAHHWTIKHLMMTTGTCKMPPKGHLANNSPSPCLDLDRLHNVSSFEFWIGLFVAKYYVLACFVCFTRQLL